MQKNGVVVAGLIASALTACSGWSVADDPDGGNSTSTDASAGVDTLAADVSASPDAAGDDPYCPVVGYSACGGDVVGTWALRSLCPDDPVAAAALCEHPYDDRSECTGPGNEAICDSTNTGTFVFNADESLEFTTGYSMVATWNYTDACLMAAPLSGSSAEARCAAMANDHLSCVYDGGCTCVSDPMAETATDTGTYAIVDDEITIGGDPPASYCVQNGILTMDYYLYHPVSWRYWVFERE